MSDEMTEDALARVTREAEALRAKVAAVEALGYDGHIMSLNGVPQRAILVKHLDAALATTGEGK